MEEFTMNAKAKTVIAYTFASAASLGIAAINSAVDKKHRADQKEAKGYSKASESMVAYHGLEVGEYLVTRPSKYSTHLHVKPYPADMKRGIASVGEMFIIDKEIPFESDIDSGFYMVNDVLRDTVSRAFYAKDEELLLIIKGDSNVKCSRSIILGMQAVMNYAKKLGTDIEHISNHIHKADELRAKHEKRKEEAADKSNK